MLVFLSRPFRLKYGLWLCSQVRRQAVFVMDASLGHGRRISVPDPFAVTAIFRPVHSVSVASTNFNSNPVNKRYPFSLLSFVSVLVLLGVMKEL